VRERLAASVGLRSKGDPNLATGIALPTRKPFGKHAEGLELEKIGVIRRGDRSIQAELTLKRPSTPMIGVDPIRRDRYQS
jgi:hypothetical protein